MSDDEWQDQLRRLFWGVSALYSPTVPPPGTTKMSALTAHSRAMALVYRCQSDAVAFAFRKIEAGLPNPDDHVDGRIDVAEYNRRIRAIIQEFTAELESVDGEVQEVLDEINEGEPRY